MVAGEGKSLLGAGREEETRSMSRRRPNPLIASSTLVVLASTVAVCAVWGIRTQSVSVLEEEDDKEVKVRVVETPYAPPTAGPYPYPGFAAMPRPSTVIASYPKPDKVLLPESVALNTYSNYPYGPLPTSTLQPLAPQPPPNMPPFTPWGMMQPSMTQIKIGKSEGDDEGEITVNVPQQPDWVNFPAVQLDPGSAPFGSTPNTVDAFKLYTESIKPGTTFMPQVNYTFMRNYPIMPQIPPPVDLFTGTGPNNEPPYHIRASIVGMTPLSSKPLKITGEPDDKSARKKQLQLQQLFQSERYQRSGNADRTRRMLRRMQQLERYANGLQRSMVRK